LACAVGLEVIATIEEERLVENAAAMGELLLDGLNLLATKHPDTITEARGLGLMTGLQYAEDSMGPRMSWHLARHGVLAVYTGNEPSVMRFMPPLVISEEEVDFLLDALEHAVADLEAGAGPEEEEARPHPRRRPQRAGASEDPPAPGSRT